MEKKRTKKPKPPKCPHCGARLDRVTVVRECADYYFWNEDGYYEFEDSDSGDVTFLCLECKRDITYDCDLPGLDPESLNA